MAPAVDWSRTSAYAGNVGEPYVYVNLKGRDPAGIVKPGKEYERLCSFLCAELGDLGDPATNQHIVKNVYRAAELYPGPYTHEAPDIVMDFDDASYVTSDAVQVNTVFQSDETNRGVHHPDGILLLHGPGIQENIQIRKARIVDVMPTVLHLLGTPIPGSIDGQVLIESLSKSFLSQSPVRHTVSTIPEYTSPSATADAYTNQESRQVEKRLKDLGYIT
jgi:predicted AlkP superfamily phosphohydrolase/phosphomutase